MFAWWYFGIAAGYLALALRYHLLGGTPWLVGLRVAVAAGFALLGWMQWQAIRRE